MPVRSFTVCTAMLISFGVLAQVFMMRNASAAVISATPTLPVLGQPYVSVIGAGCFPAVDLCIGAGEIVLNSVISDTFDASSESILSSAVYRGSLTTLGGVVVGPVELFGTIEQQVQGRSSPTELGSWTTQLLSLSLSGSVLGRTLLVELDTASASTGMTSITGLEQDGPYRIDSFFDVFVELTLDTVPPLTTARGPIRVELISEPTGVAMLAWGLLGLLASRRRR